MNENEFQRLMLEQFAKLEKDINNIKRAQDEMKNELINEINTIKVSQDEMKNEINTIKVTQDEIYLVVKAIEHSNNIGKAELEQHNIRISKNEGTLKKIAQVIEDDLGTVSNL